MKNVTSLLILFIVSTLFSGLAEGQAPSVQIIAKKKSGLFGMGSPKSMEITLSNQNKALPLTSDNVNGGKYFYFLLKTVGDWSFDVDFAKDDLPKLTIDQGDQKIHFAWKEEVPKDGSKAMSVGFPKNFQIHQPFLIKLDIGDDPNEQEIRIPEEYWPGYSQFSALYAKAEGLATGKQYRDAIHVYEKILESGDLKIFPRFGKINKLRTQQFGNYLDEVLHSFTATVAQPVLPPKEKINQIDELVPKFKYVVDSLPNITLQVTFVDTSVRSLVGLAGDAISRAKSYRDSLQVAADNHNTEWIIEGNLVGEHAYKYQHIIPVLADAFSSLDFSDTATALRCTLNDEMQGALTKYALAEAYESFLRACNVRFQRRLPMFPGDFLANLRRDSTAFPLPYFSMLKAVEDYYRKDFVSSKNDIKSILRSCDNPDLLARFHQLRVQLDIKLAQVPPVVISQLIEARQAEARGDESGTLDHYKQAMSIAPNFAYPAHALAEYYMNTGVPIRAIPFFERAYQIDKYFIDAYREEYRFYQKSGSFKPMIQVLTLALQNGNDYWEVSYYLGAAYMGDGDPVKAIQNFEHALMLSPKSYQTTIQLGLAHQTTRNYPKAREYFNRAIELEPERQEAVDYLKNLDEMQKGAH